MFRALVLASATLVPAPLETILTFDAPASVLEGDSTLEGYECEVWIFGPSTGTRDPAETMVVFSEIFGPFHGVECRSLSQIPEGFALGACIRAIVTDPNGQLITSDCVTQEECIPLPPEDPDAPTWVRLEGFYGAPGCSPPG